MLILSMLDKSIMGVFVFTALVLFSMDGFFKEGWILIKEKDLIKLKKQIKNVRV